jgi:hypothetical protein
MALEVLFEFGIEVVRYSVVTGEYTLPRDPRTPLDAPKHAFLAFILLTSFPFSFQLSPQLLSLTHPALLLISTDHLSWAYSDFFLFFGTVHKQQLA